MTALWPVDQLMEQGLVEQTISGWTDEVDFPDFPEGYFEIPPSSGLPAGHETDNFPGISRSTESDHRYNRDCSDQENPVDHSLYCRFAGGLQVGHSHNYSE